MTDITYPQLTPTLRASGTWSVRAPFSVSSSTVYTCIAMRSFADIQREGLDAQSLVYTPVGLTDGAIIDSGSGTVFSFSKETALGINIITLADGQGNYILIPDNYITAYPSATSINYKQLILSCNLGALPANLDTSIVKSAVADQILNSFGVKATINVHALSLTSSPTYEQSLAAERARKAAITINQTSAAQISSLKKQIAALQQQVTTLTKLAVDNNLITKK